MNDGADVLPLPPKSPEFDHYEVTPEEGDDAHDVVGAPSRGIEVDQTTNDTLGEGDDVHDAWSLPPVPQFDLRRRSEEVDCTK